MSSPPEARRPLGGFDATTVGVGSMVGAGAFVVFAPAGAAAGVLLPLAVVVAGFVAYTNAAAMALLAGGLPADGAVDGREQLGSWPGFLAGWAQLTGRLAACAAVALTTGLYAAPGSAGSAAVAAVAVTTLPALLGVTRSATLTRAVISLVIPVLAFAIVVGLTSPAYSAAIGGGPGATPGVGGVLQGAGLLVFAYAGYGRSATLGHGVREPRRNIPAVVLGALGVTLGLYVLLSFSLLRSLGPIMLAETTVPLRELIRGATGAGSAGVLGAVITGAAVLAGLGGLVSLTAGLGGRALALSRRGELPETFSRVSIRYRAPWVSILGAAAVVVVLLLTVQLPTLIGCAAFGVLVHGAIVGIAALRVEDRRWFAPRWLNAVGAAGCLALALALPWGSVLGMLTVLAAGAVLRGISSRRHR
ncbi:APC family permease [uncultured Arthrobacter sp.]|uniref:APC family permease n=1 Tax=uncultured Arthrobacter sp. TaxID=114050 RepID=UPI002610D9CE|nr:APC family permease [uncultured Arthrobacter sp.]